MQDAVPNFVRLGPLPGSSAATEEVLAKRVTALNAISFPITDEESLVLAECFGPDECFGVAGTLLQLVETAHGSPSETSRELSRRGSAPHPSAPETDQAVLLNPLPSRRAPQ